MVARRTTHQKLVEWVRRYLPCENAGTVGELGGPPSLNVGDVVVSPLTGAYTSVTSSRFNGVAGTPIVEV
jgi:ornithine decarboxylase